MPTAPTFGTQLIGQTEKALNAILDRHLAETELTEPQWVTLTIAVTASGELERNQLIQRVSAALKIQDADAQARVDELTTAGLLERVGGGAAVGVTDDGAKLHGRVRGAVIEITQRLWGDLPAEDLATAGRVLSTILSRADEELVRA